MRNKRTTTLVRLLENARFEVLPTASTEDKVLEHLPRERTVTVTASPTKGLEATLDLAERLAGHGPWDAVIDTGAYEPATTRLATNALAGAQMPWSQRCEFSSRRGPERETF